ncbi:nitroreductase family protein [Truepera radiovictrix]|uniref:Nitroreductase n=1 Tax=Truepera radiovictrix (strain DSM 17093 / CIP 108686 / LMG 22925 / RQ-24) TaxID=649638 RepID=D7CUG0_TRURR|nr:nitroreductase family protein [Truepera radiovictrix]ADI15745.1 nitroreductase [Truepera radiovictrix DSM 17093]WMT58630.1 nitroreductase family protein [Truepera radiovictrix]
MRTAIPPQDAERPDRDRRAPSDYPLTDLLARRWSPRAFAETPVEPEKLASVLEAARWAPSSSNLQPWRFLVTRRKTDAFDALRACLARGNQSWTERVPVLILTLADTLLPAKGDKPAAEHAYALHDVGLAVANLTVQATALGLFVHQMAGFRPDEARAAFGIPETFRPVTVLALGYLGDPAALPAELQERERAPRRRKPLRELVFEGAWGEAAGFLEP